jgi:hypothetical protein
MGSISQDNTGSSSHTTWGWAFKHAWATREHQPDGSQKIFCRYPGCTKVYKTKLYTTSGIINHLKERHGINKSSSPNDGTKRKSDVLGPMDSLVERTSIFNPNTFMESLIAFLVRNKLPFSLVDSTEFQELLYNAQLATSRVQVELPSNDTMATRVSQMNKLHHNS